MIATIAGRDLVVGKPPLIERTTHVVALTSTGQALLERGKITLREFEDFHRFAENLAHCALIRL